MSFVDAKNLRGEIQTVPAHYLTDFPDQFKPVGSEESAAADVEESPVVPVPKPSPSAKAATSKES